MFPFQRTPGINKVKYFVIVACIISFFFMYHNLTYDQNLMLGWSSVSRDVIEGQEPFPKKNSSELTSKESLQDKAFWKYGSVNDTEYTKVFVPPKREKPEKRFPQAVIIGFAKCGTRGLLENLSLHPYIVSAGPEMHFYDRDETFLKGYDWYKNRMPFSYSNQITMEKTPAYVRHFRPRVELKKYFPDTKLIALVRNPVDRLLSDYAQKGRPPTVTEFRKFLRCSSTYNLTDKTSSVNFSTYYNHLAPYYRDFKSSQILVVDGDRLVHDPLSVVQEVETFLGIPKMFSEENFVKSETTGFFCFKGFQANAELECLGSGKGRPHVKLPPEDADLLYSYFQPLNEKLYELVNHTFNWSMR